MLARNYFLLFFVTIIFAAGTNVQTFSLRTGGVGTDLHDQLFGRLNIRRFMLTPEVLIQR